MLKHAEIVEKMVGKYLFKMFMNQEKMIAFQINLNGFWSQIYTV